MKPPKHFFVAGLAILLLETSRFNADAASQLFATDFFSGAFAQVSTTDGSTTPLAFTGSGANGLAWKPASSTMFLLHDDPTLPLASRVSSLFTVDINTGSTALVGSTGARITGLTFSADYSSLYSVFFSAASAGFWSISPLTGQGTFIGNMGIEQPIDLTTDSHGTVYGVTFNGLVFTVDTSTGIATTLFGIGTGLTATAFDADDNLYAVTLTGNELIRINLADQTTTTIGPTGLFDIRGLAFADPVPEPSLLVFFSTGIAIIAVQRRFSLTQALRG